MLKNVAKYFDPLKRFRFVFCLSTLLCRNGYRYMPFRLLSTNDFESFCFHPSTHHSVFVSCSAEDLVTSVVYKRRAAKFERKKP